MITQTTTKGKRPTIADIQNLYRAQDEAKKSSGNYADYYPFWNITTGKQAIIRFLPDVNDGNPFGFMLEKVTHALLINGEKKNVPCLTMWAEECPICKLSQSYYKMGDDSSGKAYWRKKQHLARVLVMEDPLPANEEGKTYQGRVMNVSLNFSLFNIIKDAISNGELETRPDEFIDGTDFIIKKSQQGEYASYTLSKFARKSTDLTTEQIELVEASLIDLSTLLPQKPALDTVEKMLEAAMTGSEFKEETEEVDHETGEIFVNPSVSKTVPKKITKVIQEDGDGRTVLSAQPSRKVPVEVIDDAIDDNSEDEDAEAILASLRIRRSKVEKTA